MIRVCRLDPDGEVTFPEVDENSPWAWHDLLSGYMEPFPLPAHLAGRDRIGLADEDGLMKNLPYNAWSPVLGRPIVGPVIIARSDPPEFVDLSDADVTVLDQYFRFGLVVVTPEGEKPQ